MSQTPPKFFLTTPIYYVNARPHIGHAYTTIVADVIARRSRAQGVDTWFLTGTDEHGQKIERSAAAAGIPPQEFTDKVSATFREPWRRMGITNDDFIRTTEPRHKQGVQKLFTTLEQNGFIDLQTYTGAYCVSDEAFVDIEPGSPCPECGNLTEVLSESNFYFKLSAFQKKIIDLIESEDPDQRLLIQPDTLRNEVLSFLRGNVMSELGPYIATANQHIRDLHQWEDGANATLDEAIAYLKTAKGELGRARLSKAGEFYVEGALKDLSISRTSIKWGIPVPGHPDHVIYVWLDALANYMTAVGYGSDKPEDIAKFERYWPADLHLIGKEIARFHCVYWPAFLLAAKLPLPKKIAANGWLLFQDSKMSKSKGNVVRIETILDAFGSLCPTTPTQPVILSEAQSAQSKAPDAASPAANADTFPPQPAEPTPPTKAQQDLFASDVLRYFLLREIPFGQDGNFSLEAMWNRYNSELTNGFGNQVSRVLAMISKNFHGITPQGSEDSFRNINNLASILKYDAEADNTPDLDDYLPFLKALESTRGLSVSADSEMLGRDLRKVWRLISSLDLYITAKSPWKLAGKEDAESQKQLASILYDCADTIRIITALLYPVLPYATASVWRQLGLGDIEEAARTGRLKDLEWGGLKPGTKLGQLAPIFPRADKGLTAIMMQMEDQNTPIAHANAAHDAAENTRSEFPEMSLASATVPHTAPVAEAPAAAEPVGPADASPQITIDDFAKVELRVAKVLVAERIPKADKLLRLEVDLGFEKRQILSGIAEWYTPEELIGRRIVVITNLAPRKMRGLESHGMLLAASTDGGKPHLATFADSDDLPLGSRLK